MKIPRSSGILLHPTSLPGPYGVGSLGKEARKFLDQLQAAGQRWWQILPLNPPGHGGSPYSASSAFAGNPVLIDLEALGDWLTPQELADFRERCKFFPPETFAIDTITREKYNLLHTAFQRWQTNPGKTRDDYEKFCAAEKTWLDDYSLFVALKEENHGKSWDQWPEPYIRRESTALAQARERLADKIAEVNFTQWLFFRQWSALRKEAAQRNIKFIGDIPIFVAMDSADVWANRQFFEVDDHGRAEAIAGVPPDYFSETGQRWGNPLYDWNALKQDGYAWWIARVQKVLDTVDLIRIDHFRGFAAYWRIPASEPTAIHGTWIKGPGDDFFNAVREKLGSVPFIAEDLGLITEDVFELRDRHDLPGMKVVQFAFDGNPDHPFLPHTYPQNAVAYTGTHDNDTTRGWFNKLDDLGRHGVRTYFHASDQEIVQKMIDAVLKSRANLVIFPVQDIFDLDTNARMNTPGLGEGNWGWRMTSKMLENNDVWKKLLQMTRNAAR